MSSGWAMYHLHHEGPGAESAGAQGLRVRNTIYRQERRLVVSAPALAEGFGCEDRISVTGDHLSFDGKLRCPRPALHVRPAAGDPTVYKPSLSSDFLISAISCWSAGAGTHATSWPRT